MSLLSNFLLVQFCSRIHLCQTLSSVNLSLVLSKIWLSSAYLNCGFWDSLSVPCCGPGSWRFKSVRDQCCMFQALCVCIIVLTWLTNRAKNTFWPSLFRSGFLMLPHVSERVYLVAERKIWQGTKYIIVLVFQLSAFLLQDDFQNLALGHSSISSLPLAFSQSPDFIMKTLWRPRALKA